MRQLVVLLAVTLLIGGARADARSQQSDIVLGPVLGGNHVFWLQGDGSTDSIRLWLTGTSPQTVYRRRSGVRVISELAASESRLVFRRTWETSANVVGDALAGPPQGPFSRVSSEPFCPDSNIRSIDADGTRIAYAETYCKGRRARLRVAVLEAGRRVVLRDFGGDPDFCCRPVHIAGRYVAWGTLNSVVVVDLETRRVVYRARIPLDSAGEWERFDLQSDGKILVVRPSPHEEDHADLLLFSPEHARGRLFSARGVSDARLAGGHVLFERRMSYLASELVLSDLNGQRRVLARLERGRYLLAGFDFDGQRAVWATKRDDKVWHECRPGPRRRCSTFARGVEIVWLARAENGRWIRHKLAELPFERLPVGT